MIQPPDDLRTRGLLFWEAVIEANKLDASGYILLGEACRVVDRLDRLSSSLNGKGRDWLKLEDEIEVIAGRFDNSQKINVKVVVDGLLSEARQQQLAFKTIMAQMKLGNADSKATGEKSALTKWLESAASGE